VQVVTGDTKVVNRGAADGLFSIRLAWGGAAGALPRPRNIRPGDHILVSALWVTTALP
jgi:hydrogenase maturation factor